MATPHGLVTAAEDSHVPRGAPAEDAFAGYGIMGLPFASGHVLAMRRFPASSIGPAYTSVWHRDPAGRWTFWQDQPEHVSCPRYFATADARAERRTVEVVWPDEHTVEVRIPEVALEWVSIMRSTWVTRAMNGMGALLPERAWKAAPVLAAMGRVAQTALGAGAVALKGTTPNGHRFIANPRTIWEVAAASARLGGVDLGPPGALDAQARLGDFCIPQRGIFAIGDAYFTPSSTADHAVRRTGARP